MAPRHERVMAAKKEMALLGRAFVDLTPPFYTNSRSRRETIGLCSSVSTRQEGHSDPRLPATPGERDGRPTKDRGKRLAPKKTLLKEGFLERTAEESSKLRTVGGVDGTRTRGLRRDRPAL